MEDSSSFGKTSSSGKSDVDSKESGSFHHSLIFNLQSVLETPRIRSCSFFPYTLDENSDISILFRCKKTDSKQSGMYQDFGTTLKENEPNILFSAARSYIAKCAGLFLESEQ
jgi:hypothetical protein